jgi:hypothetical protein
VSKRARRLDHNGRVIARELQSATGMAWTPYRPFLNGDERIGAVRCGRCKARQATHVSYGVMFPGRTVLCEACVTEVRL